MRSRLCMGESTSFSATSIRHTVWWCNFVYSISSYYLKLHLWMYLGSVYPHIYVWLGLPASSAAKHREEVQQQVHMLPRYALLTHTCIQSLTIFLEFTVCTQIGWFPTASLEELSMNTVIMSSWWTRSPLTCTVLDQPVWFCMSHIHFVSNSMVTLRRDDYNKHSNSFTKGLEKTIRPTFISVCMISPSRPYLCQTNADCSCLREGTASLPTLTSRQARRAVAAVRLTFQT